MSNPDSEQGVPSFISVETNRDDVTVFVTIDDDAFREAVRQEVHAELERQLRNPQDSGLLDLVGKFVESWLSRRGRRRQSD